MSSLFLLGRLFRHVDGRSTTATDAGSRYLPQQAGVCAHYIYSHMG